MYFFCRGQVDAYSIVTHCGGVRPLFGGRPSIRLEQTERAKGSGGEGAKRVGLFRCTFGKFLNLCVKLYNSKSFKEQSALCCKRDRGLISPVYSAFNYRFLFLIIMIIRFVERHTRSYRGITYTVTVYSSLTPSVKILLCEDYYYGVKSRNDKL